MTASEKIKFGCRSVDCFERLEMIGEGTYGQVYKARDKITGDIVALKKIRMDKEKEGFPITAIREIKILKKLRHENVVHLKEIVTSAENSKAKTSIYMVFEYMDHDLSGLSDNPGLKFTPEQIKCYMKQLFTGLLFCHANKVLHRDIKGSNLLINNKGILKLADFGLARHYHNEARDLTNQVITLWYRPPELLLGSTRYGPAIDMWSVGCIFAELLYGKHVFPGVNEFVQLNHIFDVCGTPDESNMPGVSKLPLFKQFAPRKRILRERFKAFDSYALDLLDKLLVLDPKKRVTAEQALKADYFFEFPLPSEPSSLPTYEPSHEFQAKRRRQQQQQQQEEYGKRPPPPRSAYSNPPPPPPQPPQGGGSRQGQGQVTRYPSQGQGGGFGGARGGGGVWGVSSRGRRWGMGFRRRRRRRRRWRGGEAWVRR